MNHSTLLKHSLTYLLCGTLSFATIYSNGEDGSTNNWRVYDNSPTGATIENIEDNNSGVIKLQGEGRSNAYFLGAKKSTYKNSWNDTSNHIFSWKMKMAEKYRITIYTQTKKGPRTFNITHSKKSKGLYREKYIGIGLGKQSMNGQWQTFSLDLNKEIQKHEYYNRIISINGIKVRGSALFDDIQTKNSLVDLVKDSCTNHKKDDDIICLEPFNRAYYLNHEMMNEVNVLHTFSTEGEWHEVRHDIIDDNHGGQVKIKKLNNTPLIQVNSYFPHSYNVDLYYSDMNKKTLTSLLTLHSDDTISIDSIETIENGSKLVEKSHHDGSGEKFEKIYDIRNLPEIPLVSSIKN